MDFSKQVILIYGPRNSSGHLAGHKCTAFGGCVCGIGPAGSLPRPNMGVAFGGG